MFFHSKESARVICWLLLGLALVVCGCGTPTVTYSRPLVTPSVPAPVPTVTHQSQPVRAEVNQPATATATCAPGEQVIGGGYIADVFENAKTLFANYPSSVTAWTIRASSPSSYILLTAVAYCVPADASLGIQILQGNGSLTCPAGTVLITGGYQSETPVNVSQQAGNGWASDGTSTYAICAGQHLATASSPLVLSHWSNWTIYAILKAGQQHSQRNGAPPA
jgi:hypothetical protein